MEVTRFIPFGNWRPGTEEIDTGSLETAENLIPIWGGWSMVRKLADYSPDSGNPLGLFTGGYCHLLTEESSVIGLRPNADIDAGNWLAYIPEDTDGTDDTLFDKVNELVPSEEEYIFIGGNPSSETCELQLSDPQETIDVVSPADESFYLKVMYEITGSNSSWTLDVKLYEAGAPLVNFPVTYALSGSSDQTLITSSYNLTTDEVGDIGDFTDLSVHLDATVPGANVELYPQETEGGTGWKNQDGDNTDLQDDIDDDPASPNDSDYMESGKMKVPGDSAKIRVRVEHDSGTEPAVGQAWTIKWRARSVNSGSGTDLPCRVALYEGDSLVQEFSDRTLTASLANYTETVTAANTQDIDDFDNLWVEIVANRSEAKEGTTFQRARVIYCMVDAASNAEARVHWVALQTPIEENILLSSKPQAYFAQSGNLFQVEEDWRNYDTVSRTSGGAYSTDPKAPWYFCSFGNTTVATNFANAPQKKGATDTDFSDLVTSPAVKAKYCATVGPHLLLGNIEYSGSVNGEADEIWWSGFNDPETFSDTADRETQANRMRLVQTGGDITGMVGGDFGIVFKSDSIYRLDYIGGDLVFSVQVIARGIGCVNQNSIIPYGNDIYFLSTAGFAVLRGGQQVEVIDGDIRRALMDSSFSDMAVNGSGNDSAFWEPSTAIGAVDQRNGVIFWLYRSVADVQVYRKRKCLTYNVLDGRWSMLSLANTVADAPNYVVTLPHFTYNNNLHRGVIFARDDATDGWTTWLESDEFYNATIQTNRFSAGVLNGKGYGDIVVTGIRPIIRAKRKNITSSSQVTLYAFDAPIQRQSQARSQVVTARFTNRDGWFPFQLSGELFAVKLELKDVTDDQFVVTGFEIRYTQASVETK